MLLPLLGTLVPVLVKAAEGLFSSKDGENAGPAKKDFVMKALEFLYDNAVSKIVHDFPGVDEKRLFLRICDVFIEECVSGMKNS